MTPKQRADRGIDDNVVVARLRAGVSREQAQSEFGAMMARFDRLYPTEFGDWGALVESFTGLSIGPARPLMNVLLGAVALVLLIGCGNTANLLLARAAERARELGVRAALGAGRGRMVRQLLTESMLIGIGEIVGVGILLAFFFLRLLPHLDPGNIPRLNEASLDGRVLLVAIVVSLATSVIAGLLPAGSASRVQLTEFLKSHSAPVESDGAKSCAECIDRRANRDGGGAAGRRRPADSQLYQGDLSGHGLFAVHIDDESLPRRPRPATDGPRGIFQKAYRKNQQFA